MIKTVVAFVIITDPDTKQVTVDRVIGKKNPSGDFFCSDNKCIYDRSVVYRSRDDAETAAQLDLQAKIDSLYSELVIYKSALSKLTGRATTL
jgi:hypothetical protein